MSPVSGATTYFLDKTQNFVQTLDGFRFIHFLDQRYQSRQGFLAVARSGFSRKVTAGKRYCLSFVLPHEKEYYEKCVTFHLFHYYQTAEYYLGSFSYPSEKALLDDFTFIPA